MQGLKIIRFIVSVSLLVTTLLPGAGNAQSGRGRPRVSDRESAPPPPPPVKVPEATAVVRKAQSGETSRFVLANGMTVIISEQHATPLASAVAYFKTGTTSGADNSSGLARLLQEMIFEGTPTRPQGRITSDIRALGGYIGADTRPAGTAFYTLVPSGKIVDGLTIQADMIQNASLPAEALNRVSSLPERFDSRLTNLITEGEGESHTLDLTKYDDPASYAMDQLYRIAFDRNRAVEGRGGRLITRDQIVEFYKTHYRPENLVISVVGDVSTFNTLIEIEKLYATFKPEAADKETAGTVKKPVANKQSAKIEQKRPAAPVAVKPAAIPVTQKGDSKPEGEPSTSATEVREQVPVGPRLRYGADRGDISQSIVTLGFETVGMNSKEWPAIEVLAALLGRGRGSRMHGALVDGLQVASRVEANYLPLPDKGLLITQIWSPPDLIDKAESAFFREADLLRREFPGEGELARAKVMLEKSFVDRTGTYPGRALALARAEALTGDYDAVVNYRNRIRAVTGQDVQQVAAKYLMLTSTSVHEYEPRSAPARTFDAESFAATVRAWAAGFAQPEGDIKVAATSDDPRLPAAKQGDERPAQEQAMLASMKPLEVRDFSTLNGPRAFVREDHTQPKVTIAILFQGGRLTEDETTSGTTELMLRSMLYGTARRPYAQVVNDLEQLGAEIDVLVEPDYAGLVLSVLARNSERALKIVRDIIEDAAFRDDDIMRARAVQIGLIRESSDSSTARTKEMLFQSLFPGHPYAFPSHGREQVLAALDRDKLLKWHEQTINRQLPLFIIVGDTDGSALVSSVIASGFKRREVDDSIKVKIPQAPKTGEKIEQRPRSQTILALGSAGPKGDSDDLIAMDVIEAAMNGRGGRLLGASGDRQDIISSAQLDNQAWFAAGAVYAYAVVTPGNESRARAELSAEFERVSSNGLTEQELAAAQSRAALLDLAMLQSQATHALRYADSIYYKKEAARVDNYADRVSKVTASDIKRVATAYLKPSSLFVCMLRGTPPPAERPAIKQDESTNKPPK